MLLDLHGEHLNTEADLLTALGRNTLPIRSEVGAATGAHLEIPDNVHKNDNPTAWG